MSGSTVRMDAESRKRQIVNAALEAIGEHGIQGATISRIAKGAGITPAALYSHYENRRAILIAALDAVYEQITDSFRASWSEDPVDLFRQICEHHKQKVLSQDKTSHAHLFLEFVASAPEEGLREVLRRKELENRDYLEAIVTDFKERGRLSPEVDAEMVAWLLACWAWAGDVANLMDATEIWHATVSDRLMGSVLEALSPSAPSAPESSSLIATSALPQVEDDTNGASHRAEVLDQYGLPDGAVFTVDELADILKVRTDVVTEILERDQIFALTLGRERRVPRRALMAFLRGMSVEEFDALVQERPAVPS